MISFRPALAAIAALFAVGTAGAHAADMGYPPVYTKGEPEPCCYEVEVESVRAGGVYLRGHIGMSNQSLRRLDYPGYAVAPDFEWLDKGGFDSAPLFGGGIGYRINDWLRTDITAEYRGKAHFSAKDRYGDGFGGLGGTNDYSAKKSELLFLANAYVDMGTWRRMTPYVGAGIGASRNTISHFRDRNIITGGGGWAGSASKWNLAWALHAGLGFEVTDQLTLDLGYSYVNLGNAETGTLRNLDANAFGPGVDCVLCAPVEFKRLDSHDFKVGMRWALGAAPKARPHYQPAAYEPEPFYPPLYTK